MFRTKPCQIPRKKKAAPLARTTQRLLLSALLMLLWFFHPVTPLAAGHEDRWAKALGYIDNQDAENAKAVVFRGRLWLLGGREWASARGHGYSVTTTDGRSWARASRPAPWASKSNYREGHSVIAFNNQLWLMGGADCRSTTGPYHVKVPLNDIWVSGDDETWTTATAHAAWSPRTGHQTVVFRGRIWLIGVANDAGYLSDVWSSADGVSWRREADTPWPARTGHSAVVFNDRIYVSGGNNGDGLHNDVWATSDGTQWDEMTPAAPWHVRTRHVSLVFNNRMWIFAGKDASTGPLVGWDCDSWSSADGREWTREADPDWIFPTDVTACVFQNSIYLMVAPNMADYSIRVSGDGVHWFYGWPIPLGKRGGHASVAFKGRVWALGGERWDDEKNYSAWENDVWSSPDGTTWTLATGCAPWSPRVSLAALVHNEKMWVIGGQIGWTTTPDPHYYPPLGANDVWSSTDGTSWTLATASAPWSPRLGHVALEHNGRMWVFGGAMQRDVWSSIDGAHWDCAVTTAPWTARSNLAAISYRGRMWVFGGYTKDGVTKNDTWSSADGRGWRMESNSAPWEPRRDHTVSVLGNRLWLIGGMTKDYSQLLDDAWLSDDGVHWQQDTRENPWGPRFNHSAAVLNNTLFIMGGGDEYHGYSYSVWYRDLPWNKVSDDWNAYH